RSLLLAPFGGGGRSMAAPAAILADDCSRLGQSQSRGGGPVPKRAVPAPRRFPLPPLVARVPRMLHRVLTGLKLAVAVYWLWAAKMLVLSANSPLEVVVALSAPLILSFHFIQALFLLRRIQVKTPFWLQLCQTLLFGALYLAPLLLEQRALRPR